MTEEIKDQRVTIMMSKSEVAAVDKWCHQFRVKSRGEGMRHLIETGMTMPAAASDVVESYNKEGDQFASAMTRLAAETRKYWEGIDISLLDPVVDTDIPSSVQRPKFAGSDDVELLINSIVDLVTSTVDAALRPDSKNLTGREQRIAALLEKGVSKPEIAEKLALNSAVVDVFIRNIENKLGKKIAPAKADASKPKGKLTFVKQAKPK